MSQSSKPLIPRLRCLATLLQQLNAQTACDAVNEAIESIESTEALRQSQSLPAGAVADMSDEAIGRVADRVYVEMRENGYTGAQGGVWWNKGMYAAGFRAATQQALQADAREKGEAKALLDALDAHMYPNDYCGYTVDKRFADVVTDARESLRAALATQPAQASERDARDEQEYEVDECFSEAEVEAAKVPGDCGCDRYEWCEVCKPQHLSEVTAAKYHAPLASKPVGAEAVTYNQDDFAPIASTDLGRAALLWVLWHHQGASSRVGQPIRFAMGMGAFDELTDEQIAQAKLWEATHPQPVTPAGGEVALYQRRTRQTFDPKHPWTPWEECSEGSFNDVKRAPVVHDWISESRALYEHPPVADAALHDAVMSAVVKLNSMAQTAPAECYAVHDILRQALIDYADRGAK